MESLQSQEPPDPNAREAGEIEFLASAVESGTRVLDAGCGRGNLLEAAAHRTGLIGAVVGLDVSPDALTVARRRSALNRNAGVDWADLSHGIAMADDAFDVVLVHRLLEDLPDPDQFLREVHRVLRPSGILAIVAATDNGRLSRENLAKMVTAAGLEIWSSESSHPSGISFRDTVFMKASKKETRTQ